jgi:hypothetical protein
MTVDQMTDEQFQRYVLDVLARGLGADGFARFLRLNCFGPGDYTRDRDAWQKDLTMDEVIGSIRSSRVSGDS